MCVYVCICVCGVVCGVVWCVVCGVVRAGGVVCVDVCACMASSKERCTFLSIGATSSRALILLFRLLYYKLMNA